MSDPLVQEVFYQKAIKHYKPNWFLKLLGFKSKDGKQFVFKWGYFDPSFGLGFEIIEFDEDHDYDHLWSFVFCFIYGKFWIHLPKWLPRHSFSEQLSEDSIRKWGFKFNDDGSHYLLLSWGSIYKFIYLPWSLDHFRTEVLMKDGTWQSQPRWNSGEEVLSKFENNIAKDVYPYKYVLQNGQIQNVQATVKVSEMEWRRKWLKAIPLFNLVKRTIDVSFSDEVGERSGSWKGGTIGCSYQMRYEETVSDCLKRMERERKF